MQVSYKLTSKVVPSVFREEQEDKNRYVTVSVVNILLVCLPDAEFGGMHLLVLYCQLQTQTRHADHFGYLYFEIERQIRTESHYFEVQSSVTRS